MAKKREKKPRYLELEAAMAEAAAVQQQRQNQNPLIARLNANVGRVTRAGNDEETLTHNVAQLNENNEVITDANNNILRAQVTEIYTFHKKHREQHEHGSGLWTASKNQEKNSFQACRSFGAIKKWKTTTYKGWGLVLNENGVPVQLGQGVDQEGNMSVVKVCKFVEGNPGRWHGYPINYRSLKEETICDTALNYWEKVLNVIDKSDINDIKNKEESPLS